MSLLGASKRRPPILVTGAPRTGTTWLGQMLAAGQELAYLEEPFNPGTADRLCPFVLDAWYQYFCSENDAVARPVVADALKLRVRWRDVMRSSKNVRQLVGGLARGARNTVHRLQGRRVLMKDPIALFSAPWLAQTFSMPVIVLIRHPGGFVGSLKRVGWRVSVERFLDQPLLMRDLLAPLREEIEVFVRDGGDDLQRSILAWRVFYSVVARFRETYPDWQYVRHEDLAQDPANGFRRLFDYCGLEWTVAVERVVREHSSAGNPDVKGETWHQIRRDSKASAASWKWRLSAAEIARIRDGTDDLAGHFYADSDWD